MIKKIISFIPIFLLGSLCAFASTPVDGVVAKCEITPRIDELKYEPDNFNTTNNLRRKAGAFLTAEGSNIAIYGRLMDKNCTPISDAKIEVWQANTYGLYQYGTAESKNDDPRAQTLFDPNFVGSGTIYTDNMGRFTILSIKPGSFQDNAPHINLRVKHDEIGQYATKIYFGDSIDNTSDKTLKTLKPNDAAKLVAVTYGTEENRDSSGIGEVGQNSVYMFDIVVDKEIQTRRY